MLGLWQLRAILLGWKVVWVEQTCAGAMVGEVGSVSEASGAEDGVDATDGVEGTSGTVVGLRYSNPLVRSTILVCLSGRASDNILRYMIRVRLLGRSKYNICMLIFSNQYKLNQ